MSRLADAIRRSQRVDSAPMGFGAAKPAAKATLLVGCITPAAAGGSALGEGADFIVIDAKGASVSESDVKGLRAAAADLPIGARTRVTGAAAARALRESGLDFLVIDAESTPAAALLDDDLGYVLAVPARPEELLLRSLEPLSLEALLLSELPSPLTVAAQIELSRVSVLGRKPLVCEVPGDASSEDLQCLRAAGVVAVITDAKAVASLKATVAALPARRNRREDRTVVSLPHGRLPQASDDDDDDDSLA